MTLHTTQKRFGNLVRLWKTLLVLPHSNADPERLFSMVQKVETEQRASLNPATVHDLLSVKMNTDLSCFNCHQIFTSELLPSLFCPPSFLCVSLYREDYGRGRRLMHSVQMFRKIMIGCGVRLRCGRGKMWRVIKEITGFLGVQYYLMGNVTRHFMWSKVL